MRKKIIFLVWAAALYLMSGVSMSAAVNAENIDSLEAEYLANNIMDTSLRMGVFECPGNTPVRHLRSGIMPEEQDNYLETAIGNGVMKLNTIHGFEHFDSVVFVPMPTVYIEVEAPLQFIPYPETRWVLFLRRIYDDNGIAMTDWALQIKEAGAAAYLNPATVFELGSTYNGNACILWNDSFPRQEYIPMATTDMYSDLLHIRRTIVTLPKGDEDAQKAARLQMLNTMIGQLKDPYGKAVGEIVKQRVM